MMAKDLFKENLKYFSMNTKFSTKKLALPFSRENNVGKCILNKAEELEQQNKSLKKILISDLNFCKLKKELGENAKEIKVLFEEDKHLHPHIGVILESKFCNIEVFPTFEFCENDALIQYSINTLTKSQEIKNLKEKINRLESKLG